MNRYTWWKYGIMGVVLTLALLYTAPNFFGEAPAVQISAARGSAVLGPQAVAQVEQALAAGQLRAQSVVLEGSSVRVLFRDTETQLRARDALERTLNQTTAASAAPVAPRYIIALALVSRSPSWLSALRAYPMYLGLDLRGGVHFLMQVDTSAVSVQRAELLASQLRQGLRQENIRQVGVRREGTQVLLTVAEPAQQERLLRWLADNHAEWRVEPDPAQTSRLRLSMLPRALAAHQQAALKQNIHTLHNRVNELGVAEPVIQQQGADRIVVQLPGVQDTAKAKDIIGRTATLELRMVDESPTGLAAEMGLGAVPLDSEVFLDRAGRTVVVKREVVTTGDNLTDAQPGFDNQTHEPVVLLSMDATGARAMQTVSRENLKKRMAIILFEQGRGEVLTAPVIQSELGGRFQISGSMSSSEATDLALLLRAGALAAPMQIIEERTIGPSLGADNIAKGYNSVMWGFAAIVLFMVVYYALFGVISSLALGLNLLMLVGVLSMLQATLTLPGMAAVALTLGMAIDANVLINERIREELRKGLAPQQAIHIGYQQAWGTILDSNITTLIAGVALLVFGSGPVRGFAVVHCLGILTSMFSAVFFSRGLVNLWYGSQRRLQRISIGTVWRPSEESDATQKIRPLSP